MYNIATGEFATAILAYVDGVGKFTMTKQ